MNDIFKDLIILGKVTIYLDDILIFTNDIEEHRTLVHEVLKRLAERDLFCKPEKCEFEQPKVEYLGVLISENRVEMDPVKVKGIAAWPVPQNASDVWKFRGFANFYRRFIKDFSAVCKSLDRLTGNAPWKWEAEEQEAFDELKRRFTESPVLSMYNPDCKTRIEVDVSGYATGAVARWALYLSRFELVILHKPGTSNGRADALLRRPDHQTDDADDNLDH
ncbi:hypothetical protein GSI_11505 [Ganoderma sinense ZZ0214-1]|uniref:Reverse transcriptase domain-containing protein n=1 Tax=Ganoderma sinense ZZ0214-1 TaxID=1077348 RepID=A0A2G8RW60_9APHY|nr:hypothetical protein GSI_11505 [Ganoderma sinense ZZ0214-1]